MRVLATLTFACLFAAQGFSQTNQSPPGPNKSNHPVAIRWWGQGMISIESYWNQTVVIDPYSAGIGYDVPDITGSAVLVTHEHGDHNNVNAVKGDPIVVRGLDKEGRVQDIHHCLDRFENSNKSDWWENKKSISAKQTDHTIYVKTIPAWHDDQQGAERGANALFVVMVNGMTIVHCGDLGQTKLSDDQLEALKHVDILLLPVGGVYTIDGQKAWGIVEQVKPRIVVPIHYKTDKLKIPLEPVDRFLVHKPKDWKVEKLPHNTLAASAKDGEESHSGTVVVLDYKPWKPKGELAALLEKMDASCKASQQVFAKLSTEQMNWRPPNGTHTPRWNTEHMMGRQLGFFSQIYATIDPATFSHINLNPAQMPPDYKAAHADWDGAEEARQMQRANAYVRRFAYLLEDLDLGERAPGSGWRLGGLLRQMDRHYDEHTANVVKKFELEGWPAE